jgi:hypothetical protein
MEDEPRTNDKCSIIVQLPLTGFWGTEEQLAKRNDLARAFDTVFAAHDWHGFFDGTDTGSGTTNLFIEEIADSNWDEALEKVIAELRTRGLLDVAVIARSVEVGPEEGPWAEHTVVWPPGYLGEFNIF